MTKSFYNNLFLENQEKNWNDAPGKLVIFKYIFENFQKVEGNFIDIGCGSGYFTNEIAKTFPGLSVSGFDFSETAIEKAKATFSNIEFSVDDVHNESWAQKGPYNIAISYGCFEHFEKPEMALGVLAKALKPGGVFLLMIPTLGFYRTDRDDEGWYQDFNVPPQMQWNLKRSTWEESFEKAGLKLFDLECSKEYGALNPGNFYFGEKK